MEDLIKRSDAIAAVWKPQVKPNELIFGALKTAIESEINNVPSVDIPTWIPCSERLPEATGFYICTVNRELFDVRTVKFEMLAEGGYRWLLRNGLEVFPSFVLAWMPLPKPWKGADDES